MKHTDEQQSDVMRPSTEETLSQGRWPYTLLAPIMAWTCLIQSPRSDIWMQVSFFGLIFSAGFAVVGWWYRWRLSRFVQPS